MKNPWTVLISALVYTIISVILLTLPGTNFPEEDWLDKIWFDKWVHIGMFTILVVLWCLFYQRFKKKKNTAWSLKKVFTIIAYACFAFGIAMEFVQLYWVPFRSFDLFDIIADGVGVAIGWIFSCRRYIKK